MKHVEPMEPGEENAAFMGCGLYLGKESSVCIFRFVCYYVHVRLSFNDVILATKSVKPPWIFEQLLFWNTCIFHAPYAEKHDKL